MKRLKICLINPKFEPSYWGFDYALPLYPGGVKCTMVTGALAHLAGLVSSHEIYLLDENVEAIDFDFLETFDLVGVTGMNVQKERMREILLELRRRKIFTLVGGAYASVDEHFFDGLCDVLFSGEADEKIIGTYGKIALEGVCCSGQNIIIILTKVNVVRDRCFAGIPC